MSGHLSGCATCAARVKDAEEAPAAVRQRPDEATLSLDGSPPRSTSIVKDHLHGGQPLDGEPSAPSARLAVGASLGRFIVVEVLGEGGMGVVYAAYDPTLERKVAIKFLHSGSASDEDGDSRTRLLREAQAMAQLSHPNVVSVFETGTFGRQVYVAMELVEGQTLKKWLREKPRTRREIFDAFFAAGRGLAAAHAKGLIHRDFKPDNVLVGRDGRVRVTDFGLARYQGDLPEVLTRNDMAPPLDAEDSDPPSSPSGYSALETPLTRTGVVMGTPAYMAPEQHRAQPNDARTDQFAFTVALYEALCGRRPFSGSGGALVENVTLGRVDEPPKSAKVPGWLRKVLLKALSPGPDDRYPSMDALLDALSQDPQVRRRRWGATALAALALLAAVLGTRALTRHQRAVCEGAALKLQGTWDEPAQRRAAQAFLATGRPYAADTWRRVQATLDGYAREWTSLRTQACEATLVRGEQTEHQLALRMECLDRRLGELSALSQVFATANPRTLDNAINASGALTPLAGCSDLKALGNPGQVEPPDHRPAIASARAAFARGKALHDAGEALKAKPVLEAALVEATPTGYAPLLAEIHFWLAETFLSLGIPKLGVPHFEQSYREAQRASDEQATALAGVLLVQGWGVWLSRWELGHALAVIADGLVIRAGDDPLLRARLEIALSGIATSEGNLSEARGHLTRARQLLEGLPSPAARRLSAVAGQELGYALLTTGQVAEGLEMVRRSKAAFEELYGPDNPQLAIITGMLAEAALWMGELADAKASEERALALMIAGQGPDNVRLIHQFSVLGLIQCLSGEAQAGLESAQREAALAKLPEADVEDRIEAEQGVGVILRELGKSQEALVHHKMALELEEAETGKDSQSVASALQEVGVTQLAAGLDAEALATLDHALAIHEKLVDLQLWQLFAFRSRPLRRLGRPAEALASAQRAVALLEKGLRYPVDEAFARFELAQGLWTVKKDSAAARDEAEKARALWAKFPGRAAQRKEVEQWLEKNAR